uniref:Putative lividomycin production protein n=1 Tax=Streptomyces lividus TaxID=282216 RepID=Q2MF54_STRLV|nr:putative lividomycin production protein [Streptomyces lividus]
MTLMLVLKCLSDQTGDSAEEIAEAGYVEGDDRDYVEAVNRLESYFDCTLDLLGADGRRIVVEDVVARIPAGAGVLAGGRD